MHAHRYAAICFSFVFSFFSASEARAQAFSDARVQSPEIKAPERGSVAGQLAHTIFGPADVSRGDFTLPSPFEAPDERGASLASPFPAYSPDAPLSEWGMGWKA